MRDQTERRTAEEQNRKAIWAKNPVLQEPHQRVTKNLQVITSLLSIQANRLDPEIAAVVKAAENRVRAIALIHETLYSSVNLASIDFGIYLDRLVPEIFAIHGAPGNVRFQIHRIDMILDIGQAIPLGLILNELVINAIQHGFPDKRPGRVEVCLESLSESIDRARGQTLEAGLGRLTVQDDGVGLPGGVEVREAESIGLHLVNTLARQLRGELRVNPRESGTSVAVTFPLVIK